MLKKRTTIFILATLLIVLISFFAKPAFCGYVRIAEFICQQGIEYYEKGDYAKALREFNKVLLVSPEGEQADIANNYIEIIEEEVLSAKRERDLTHQQAIYRAFEQAERRFKIEELPQQPPIVIPAAPVVPEEKAPAKTISREIISEQVLREKLLLDEELRATGPSVSLELELNQAFVTEGREIVRWLVTSPDNLSAERIDLDRIKVSGKKIGQSFLHIWDQNGRWTLNIKIIPPRYIQRLVKEYREKLEEMEPFKFRYSFDRYSFHRGDEIDSTSRQTLTFDQWLGLSGETPYGNFDTLAQISKLRETTDLTHFTIGLSDASIGKVKDFDIRAFDYTAGFSRLSFPGESLRGVRFKQRLLEERLSYTTIWGREGQGKFGRLSPGLAEVKDAFIYGGQLDYSPSESLHYRLSSAWGYGDEREEYLKDNVLGLEVDYRVKKGLTLGAELAYDSDDFALLLNSQIVAPKLRLSGEFRNLEKDFLTITGRPSGAGEVGAMFEANYAPFSWLNFSSDLDVYRDRLFPNPDSPRRLNLNVNSAADLSVDPTTSLRLNYQYVDESGKLSPRKANSFSAGINKRFPGLRNLSTYLNYRYMDSENPNSPTMDYSRNSLTAGLSFKILDNLSYFVSQEMSWLTDEYSDEDSYPRALQTGLDYSQQLFDLPLYTTLRFNYRDEKDAASSHSFLSGEDSIELFGEFTYRPTSDFELFASSRLKNIWADNPDAESRAEIDIRVGGRLLWDTGLSWNPVCSVMGQVYKDLNDDGRKQDGEPGLGNIRIIVGSKEVLTSDSGFYIIKGIRGKQANVAIDVSTLPEGFIVSGPDLQPLKIEQAKTLAVDFAIVSRSEIYGVVFEDVNGDGVFRAGDIGVKQVELSLEDGRKTVTDSKGQYYFRRVGTGEHTITLNIDSLTLDYLPTVPLTKEITLFEGITYIHHIPLKRVK